MATKHDLQDWVHQALMSLGGKATIVEVAKEIWSRHEKELRHSGNLLYTWQYDIRWAATMLRKRKIMKSNQVSPRGIWEIN